MMTKKEERKKTESFIEKYLVDAPIGKGYGLYRMVAESRGTDKQKVAGLIRQMDYRGEYMKTRYWQLVAQQVKSDAGWCCIRCESRHNLAVHHPDYVRLGYDMYYADELQCLCRKCHEQIHGIRKSRLREDVPAMTRRKSRIPA